MAPNAPAAGRSVDGHLRSERFQRDGERELTSTRADAQNHNRQFLSVVRT